MKGGKKAALTGERRGEETKTRRWRRGRKERN